MSRPKSSTLVGVDVYVRHTDINGRSHVEHHRAWDRDLFLKSLARAAAGVGGEAKAEALTEEQYQRARRKQR